MKPDTTISHYRIRASLGAGGMGEVHLAEDTKLHRKVAIKLLHPGPDSSGTASKRLLREARTAAALDHPNICAIYEVSEEDGRGFIVMQYVEGETLHVRMKRGPLPFSDALSIARQVADALSEAHAHGTIHRDIKPANIMITARGVVKVMDFGLATRAQGGAADDPAETETGLTTPGSVLGTVPYMSPEQVRGEPLDARSDLFSFGVVLYEIVSGHQPFAAGSSAGTLSAILTEDPQPLARYSKDATDELQRIVAKSLRKDRDSRYQTAKDLLIDLRALEDDVRHGGGRDRSGPATSPVEPVTQATSSLPTADTAGSAATPARSWRRAAVAAIVVGVAAAGIWIYRGRANLAWAQAQVPRIEALVQARDYFGAYDLAVAVRPYLPADPTITRLLPEIADTLSITTTPAGADVYLRRFAPDRAGVSPARTRIGVTPIENLEIARGQYIISIEREGYAPFERTVSGAQFRFNERAIRMPPIRIAQTLIPAGTIPDRMALVSGSEYRLVAWARPTDARLKLGDYFIDKYEVSNQEYGEFISTGGYLKKEFWKHPFVKDGRALAWEEAMKALVDRTGLPGPRGWSGQMFPSGLADHPVTDVSWYEAAAYAAFRGKELPTVFQWEKAARNGNVHSLANFMPWGIFYPGDTLLDHANFEGTGTVPVAANAFGASPFGAYNMAGNVAEWCQNETSQGYITSGGAYGEPPYLFARYGTFPGFYSSNKLGFRCARRRAQDRSADPSAMRIEIGSEIPTYRPSTRASFDEALEHYRYDKALLDAKVVETTETAGWRREKINFAGADGDRAIGYLYLPKQFARPLQVVHFVPANNVAIGLQSLPASMEDYLGPCVRAGRAVFGVVLRGYQERRPNPESSAEPAPTTAEYRDKIVNWITDLRRGLDYLETRRDVDVGRLGFFAPSAGSRVGLILTAVENRYRSVFLTGSGVRKAYGTWITGTNPIDFAAHIKGPTFMFQGRYDESMGLKTEAEPLFKLLPEPKRLVVFEGGHIAPFELLVTTMNAWLDETLGPVKRQ